MAFLLIIVYFVFLCQYSVSSVEKTYTLTNRNTSYVMMKKLPFGSSTIYRIMFQIKTHVKDSLLLYLDDGGYHDYLELRLNDGYLQTILKDGGEGLPCFVTKTHFDHRLNDLLWHKVDVRLNASRLIVIVDQDKDIVLSCSVNSQRSFRASAGLYFGGVPDTKKPWVTAKTYTNPSVLLQSSQRFIGCVGGIEYAIGSFNSLQLAPVYEKEDVESGCNNKCNPNPCLNRGSCFNLFSTFLCDCRRTGFSGPLCGNEAQSIHFSGNEVLVLNAKYINVVGEEPGNDRILLRFTALSLSSVIFHLVGLNHFVRLAIRDSQLELLVGLNGNNEAVRVPNMVAHRWYDIKVERRGTTFFLQVNNHPEFHIRIVTPTSTWVPNYVSMSIGGLTDDDGAPLKTRGLSPTNFRGCVQQLHFNKIDIISQSVRIPRSHGLRVIGNLTSTCQVYSNVLSTNNGDAIPRPPKGGGRGVTAPTWIAVSQVDSDHASPISVESTERAQTWTSTYPVPSANPSTTSQPSSHQETSHSPIYKSPSPLARHNDEDGVSKDVIAWISAGAVVAVIIVIVLATTLYQQCRRRRRREWPFSFKSLEYPSTTLSSTSTYVNSFPRSSSKCSTRTTTDSFRS